VNAFPTYNGHSYSFFAGDDWKVNRRLTLNLGLRYDFQASPVERRGKESNFNPYIPNPTNPALLGAMQYAQVDYGDTTVLPDRKNFGPRVGFRMGSQREGYHRPARRIRNPLHADVGRQLPAKRERLFEYDELRRARK
jgi:hypothetical protein